MMPVRLLSFDPIFDPKQNQKTLGAGIFWNCVLPQKVAKIRNRHNHIKQTGQELLAAPARFAGRVSPLLLRGFSLVSQVRHLLDVLFQSIAGVLSHGFADGGVGVHGEAAAIVASVIL